MTIMSTLMHVVIRSVMMVVVVIDFSRVIAVVVDRTRTTTVVSAVIPSSIMPNSSVMSFITVLVMSGLYDFSRS